MDSMLFGAAALCLLGLGLLPLAFAALSPASASNSEDVPILATLKIHESKSKNKKNKPEAESSSRRHSRGNSCSNIGRGDCIPSTSWDVETREPPFLDNINYQSKLHKDLLCRYNELISLRDRLNVQQVSDFISFLNVVYERHDENTRKLTFKAKMLKLRSDKTSDPNRRAEIDQEKARLEFQLEMLWSDTKVLDWLRTHLRRSPAYRQMLAFG